MACVINIKTKKMINEGGIIWKTKEEMTNVELLNLRLGHYITGKIINGKIYYNIM